jgi:hypothetical protein
MNVTVTSRVTSLVTGSSVTPALFRKAYKFTAVEDDE